jgi:hypothetical protein
MNTFQTTRDRAAVAILCALCLSLAALAGAGETASGQRPAALPAKESHEGLLIAADPYHDAERSKARFGKKHPQEAGILAIEVHLRNDTKRAIQLDLAAIRLLLAPPGNSRQRLEPMSLEAVIERTLYKERGGPDIKAPRIPIPRRPQDRSKEWKKLEEAWRPLLLEMDILPPQSSVQGFLFFNLGRNPEWVSFARLYVPSLKFVDTGQELFYFEVDLSKAAPRP